MRLKDRVRKLLATERLAVGQNAVLRAHTSGSAYSDLTPAQIAALDVVAGTAAASKAVVLDSNGDVTLPGEMILAGNGLAAAPGAGISTGTGTLVKGGVVKIGDLITTRIFLDITGLASVATDTDIIGVNGGGAAYLTQLTAAINGTIFGGKMTCLEAPATGEVDIDVYAADEATGNQDDLVTGLTETQIVDAAADWTLGLEKILSAMPTADQYLYLAVGTASTPVAGTYTAGKFLLELYGYDA